MAEYISNDAVCRQVQLVKYFGEDSSEPCGTCEVCIANRKRRTAEQDTQSSIHKDAAQAILTILSDGGSHRLSELSALPFTAQELSIAIDSLLKHNSIEADAITIRRT